MPADSHGCLTCAHKAIGPAIAGSPDVNVNGMPALRVGDPGEHSSCCGAQTWVAQKGSGTVMINNLPAHRKTDVTMHCGGPGNLNEGSPNVEVGG